MSTIQKFTFSKRSMQIKRKGYIFLCLIFLQNTFLFSGELSEKKKIFYLNSYDITFHTYESSIKAINEVFNQYEYTIDADFMDSKRFIVENLPVNLKERIKLKLELRGKYDMVLTSDDNALLFVLDNYEELFTNTPVVFWGFDNIEKARQLDTTKFITGVIESMLVKETIDLIKTAQPNVTGIIALTDNTNTGIIDFNIFQSIKSRFSELTLSEIKTNEFTTRELQDTINNLTTDKAILKISAYNLKDANLNLYDQYELFYKNSPVPVYCLGVSELQLGLIGGCLSDYYENAHLACQMAKEILKGSPVSDFDIIYNCPGKKMINYQTFLKYKFSEKLLPKDVTLFGAPSSKLNIRKDFFYAIVLSLLVALLLLGFNFRLVIHKRRLANKLRISQQNYEILFRESPSVNLLIEPKSGKITDANNVALKYYGYSIEEIKMLNITDINTLPETDVHEKMEQAHRGVSKGFIFSHRKKNGQIRDVEVYTALLKLNNQSFFHSIVVDVNDRLKAERELIEAKQKAEESDNLKTSFLANMSHEIRTPMNSILGFSDLLINDEVQVEKQTEYLKMIHSNGTHLLNLINDIIDISKIEANQLRISKKETSVNIILDELFLDFSNRKINNNLKFKFELTKGSQNDNFSIITDGLRLKQILINLLSNAFKFTDDGLIQFGYKIRKDGILQFFVKDSGIGIPEDKHELVFSVFQRLEDSYDKNYSGAGLGLSITKSLVEKLGGHIWLMSKPGEGARFYFTIPGDNGKLKI